MFESSFVNSDWYVLVFFGFFYLLWNALAMVPFSYSYIKTGHTHKSSSINNILSFKVTGHQFEIVDRRLGAFNTFSV